MFVLMKDSKNSEPPRALSVQLSGSSPRSHRQQQQQQQHETSEDMAEHTRRLQRQRAGTFAAFMCFGLASWIMTNGTRSVVVAALGLVICVCTYRLIFFYM